jgi:PAS domain S-box-containing protein
MTEFRVDDLDPHGSEELLKSFFADAAVGLSITDLQGRFVRVNRSYCELTGYTEAELTARDFQSITHPDDLPRTLAKFQSLLSGNISSFLIEKRYIRKDAIIVWVLSSVSLMRDDQGRPIYVVRLSQDITEQLQLEESLPEAEIRTESILAHIKDVYLLLDHRWRYLYANDAAVRAIGRPREQILGRTLWQIFPDLAGTDLEREYRRAMDERVTVNCDFYYPARDNWWENRFYPVPAGLAVFATDITERRRAEEAVRDSKDHLRLVIDTIPVMAWSLRPDGIVDFLNQGWMNYAGFSLEQYVQDPTGPVHPEDIPRVVKKWRADMAAGRPNEDEMRLRRIDGQYRWFLVRNAPLHDDRGSLIKWYGISVDIEDRKRAEEALREAEQKYRDIFENAEEGIFQSTPDGQYLSANPALARMHGFDAPDEFLARRQDIPREVYVDPGRREEFKRLLEEHGVVHGFEHQIYRKDGSKIWISVNARAVRDEQGKIHYYEGTTQDISERKRAEVRSTAFTALARKLSGARVPLDAARIVVDTADGLFGWDSCTFDLYDQVEDLINPILRVDLIGEVRTDVPAEPEKKPPSPRCRHILEHGATLKLRRPPYEFDDDPFRFGDTNRPSASIMTLPIRHAAEIVGVLSIQSYQPRAYDNEALSNLEALADYCGEALNRIRAEQALRESEERFSKAFYSSPAPLIITRLIDGCFLNANDSFLSSFGYAREEVIGKTTRDLNIYVDYQDRKKLIAELREQGALQEYESRARTKDGRILDLLVFVEPVKLKGEQCILSTAYDITERKRIEEALRQSEERYRELFENAKDALYVHDLGGRYTSFNRAAEKLSGFTRDEIIGKHFSNFVAPTHLRNARENLCRKLDVEGETTYEIDLITKDRRRVPVEVSSRLIFENGEPIGVQGVARDITERKRADEARARIALIVESSDDAIIGKTIDGTILSWNSGAEKIYGYSAREVIGCHVSILVPTDRQHEIAGHLEILRRGESINHYETLGNRKDGKLINVSLTISPIRDARNHVVGVSTIARDVTRNKLAEEALQTFSRRLIEAQEAERKHIARELHDEIGQVLTAVRINLQSLQSSMPPASQPSRIDESLGIVDEALDRVRELSLNLRPPVLDNLGLNSALRWYIDRYARRSGIVADLQSDLEDGRRLQMELETACFRIVQEALTNVARHAQATHVLVSLKRSNGSLELDIKDNGVGFNVETLLKTSPSAWALGLRGMEERAVAVHGCLKVDSAPMRGTEVKASFPLKK